MAIRISVTRSHSFSLDKYHGAFHEKSTAGAYSSFIIARAEVVRCLLFILAAWVWSQCNPFGICIAHSGGETGLSPSTY